LRSFQRHVETGDTFGITSPGCGAGPQMLETNISNNRGARNNPEEVPLKRNGGGASKRCLQGWIIGRRTHPPKSPIKS
jgi:hypothetical protein